MGRSWLPVIEPRGLRVGKHLLGDCFQFKLSAISFLRYTNVDRMTLQHGGQLGEILSRRTYEIKYKQKQR